MRDVDAQVRALQFVAEYKQLIASIEALSGEFPRGQLQAKERRV